MERLLDLDLGDLVGVDGVVFKSRRGELTLRVEDFTVLAKSLRPPPEKHHGLQDVETRYRRRELDLMANEETRELFITRAKIVAAVRRYLDDAGLHRGRDAGPAAALRRGAGAAVHHAPQRAGPHAVPAHRHRAVPQALHRRRPGARLRAGQGLPQRGRLVQAQPRVHDARVVRGLRGLQRRGATAWRSWSRASPRRSATTARSSFAPPWRRVTLRDAIARARRASTCSSARERDALVAAIESSERRPADGGPHLAAARRRPALEVRRAEAPASRRSSSTTRSSCRRSPRTTAPSRGWSSASRRSLAGMEIANAFTELNDPDEQRARFEAQERLAAAGRRGGAAVRRGLRPGARAGHAADRRPRPRHRPPRDGARPAGARSARSCSSRRCATEAMREGARAVPLSDGHRARPGGTSAAAAAGPTTGPSPSSGQPRYAPPWPPRSTVGQRAVLAVLLPVRMPVGRVRTCTSRWRSRWRAAGRCALAGCGC